MSPKETKEKYGSWYSYRRHRKLIWRSLGKVETFCSFYFYLYRSLSIIIYTYLGAFKYYIIYRASPENLGAGEKVWGLSSFISRPRKRGETIYPHL